MKTIKLYSKPLCGWCQDAKAYLKQHSIPFESIDVGADQAAYAEMQKLSGQTYVPTIVVNGKVLADFDVAALEKFLAQFN
ncbi:MAG: glutaredoxin domain-containing protein [Verrucomicrobiota bacterium]